MSEHSSHKLNSQGNSRKGSGTFQPGPPSQRIRTFLGNLRVIRIVDDGECIDCAVGRIVRLAEFGISRFHLKWSKHLARSLGRLGGVLTKYIFQFDQFSLNPADGRAWNTFSEFLANPQVPISMH